MRLAWHSFVVRAFVELCDQSKLIYMHGIRTEVYFYLVVCIKFQRFYVYAVYSRDKNKTPWQSLFSEPRLQYQKIG